MHSKFCLNGLCPTAGGSALLNVLIRFYFMRREMLSLPRRGFASGATGAPPQVVVYE
jgi:hypothetical protein